MMTRLTALAAVCALAAAQAPSIAAAQTQPAPSFRVAGVGINVADIAKSEAFYTQVVGLKVGIRVPALGPPKEVALTVSGKLTMGEAIVVLANLGEPLKEGRQSFGRVILNTGDAAPIVARARAGGYAVTTHGSSANPVYFITDPDGYQIELYPSPPAK